MIVQAMPAGSHQGEYQMRDLNETEQRDLEALIDRCGIDSVLMAISEICGAKGEHVATYWQDRTLALRWHTLEGAVGCIVPKATGL
jgi:hypothetical protein